MAWLGEEFPAADAKLKGPSSPEIELPVPFKAPRTCKDVISEQLFVKRRSLFTNVEMVFFDTTSIYFEGGGGGEIDQHGYSKDHRPDLIYHKCDETIRGHVFCSFLALILMKELQICLAARGWTVEWSRYFQFRMFCGVVWHSTDVDVRRKETRTFRVALFCM